MAVLRSTGPAGFDPEGFDPEGFGPEGFGLLTAGPLWAGPTELPRAAGSPAGVAMPTTICSPSTMWRARLRPTVSAPLSGPPAADIASATRAPGSSVTRPGCCTSPTTLTTTE